MADQPEPKASTESRAVLLRKALAARPWTGPRRIHNDLASNLWEGATTAGQAAIELYISQKPSERMWAAIAVGTALELALKRVIVDISAALIGADRVVDSKLALAGHPMPNTSLSSTRTITGNEAADLVRNAYKGVAPMQRCLAVFSVRNGAAHLGYIEQNALEAAVADLVVIIDALLPIIGKTSDAFWGAENTPLIDHILVETKDALLVRIEALFAAARRELDLKSRLGDEVFLRVAQALSMKSETENNGQDVGQDVIAHSCPVCGYDGQLSRYIDEPDMEFLRSPRREPGDGHRTASPDEFDCYVCNLHLNYAEMEIIDGFEPEELAPSEHFLEALEAWDEERDEDVRQQEAGAALRESHMREIDDEVDYIVERFGLDL
ncbi:hypothetical protein QN357_13485 [Cryobacterium sp. RTC2.1]|uniref:hypothetical protein n=1 Tax=Cryobacterium sp. RTC2.1 TaxID=3048634 RepID=UPI002B23E3AD|nr:hypothetical protein [Cryobacterium sp. RTC2.1]MEB0003940.1 hypothetical protein [Cryobacterium sp. RTC2.1]